MIEKKDIINLLFVASFPMFGLGYFVSATITPALGFLISVSCNIMVILFYAVDLLYKNEFQVKINSLFLVMLLFLFSCIVSIVRAFLKGLPDETVLMMA